MHMVRALFAASILLLAAIAATPTASADHLRGPCDTVHWYPSPPPGWNYVCLGEDLTNIALHAALDVADRVGDEVGPTLDCIYGYNVLYSPPAYVLGCL